MKRAFALLVLILVLFILPITTWAQNNNGRKDIVLPKNEVVNKDYFAAGNSVLLDGTVNGDAYLAAGNIVVNGTVNGDLLTAGGNIDIRGNVTGNVRAAGGNINISGIVNRHVTAAGGSINLTSSADIKGSLASAGGNLAIFSPIGKEANLAGGQATLGNKIGGDVNAFVGQLSLLSSASVNGNLTYQSQNTASISPEATVSGKVTQTLPPKKQEKEKQTAIALFSFISIIDLLLSFIIGIALIKFFSAYFDNTTSVVAQKPWLSLGIGFLTAIVFPFALLLLLVTIIGIPIAVFLIFILAVFFYTAKIFVSFVIGQLILKQFNKDFHKIWSLLVGIIIYGIFTAIPILGWLISMTVGLIGAGAILISDKYFYQDLRRKKLI